MAGRQAAEALLASEAQRTALGGAERRADIAQEAGLFGEVAGQGMGFPRQTMAGEEAALRSELARSADERAAQAQQAQLFGQVAGQGGPIQTLGGMQALEAIEGQRLAREATEAGLTGQFRGDLTAAERAQLSALDTQDLQRRLAQAGVTGELEMEGSRPPIQTLQAQALASEMQGQALQRALQRAGATGEFIEEGADADAAVPTLERRLREAALTGRLGEDPTLAGRQADMDLIGAIMAGAEVSDKPGMPQLMSALTENIQNFDPNTVAAIQDALQTGFDFQRQPAVIDPSTMSEDEYLNLTRKVDAINAANEKNEGTSVIVDGETVGGSGGGESPHGERSQAWRDFHLNNNLASGKYFFKEVGGKQKVYSSDGRVVATFNAQTGKYE
jgi:hypothetical protein